MQLAVYLERDHGTWMKSCNEEINNRELKTNSKIMIHTDEDQTSSELKKDLFQPVQIPLLPLSSRLVTPVQRFQRYHMLLENLHKHETDEFAR